MFLSHAVTSALLDLLPGTSRFSSQIFQYVAESAVMSPSMWQTWLMEDIGYAVPHSWYVAVCHSREMHLVSGQAESNKTTVWEIFLQSLDDQTTGPHGASDTTLWWISNLQQFTNYTIHSFNPTPRKQRRLDLSTMLCDSAYGFTWVESSVHHVKTKIYRQMNREYIEILVNQWPPCSKHH